ncbi:hypothetical protein LTS08_003426 [Lithohypha guttulata]|nr:hypothetical protein LTS08_003426 [Lithohypha guttulata]
MQASGALETRETELYAGRLSTASIPARVPLISGTDALAGAIGGVVSVLLGQPFDLIRVRLQTSNSSNVLKTAKDIWVYEGPRAFYKGAAVPFAGVGVCVGIQFATFHSLRRTLAKDNQPSVVQSYICGGAAGAANSLISSPVEHIRTRLQLQPHGAGRLYSGPVECIKAIVRQAGIRGIFKAYPVALVKEIQAFGCYFAAFEASMTGLCTLQGKLRSDLTVWETIPCGALGGIGFWVGSFPIDVIKTRLQGDAFGEAAQYRSARMAVAKTWQEGGVKAFWRGLSPTLGRADKKVNGATTSSIARSLTTSAQAILDRRRL